MSDISIPGVSSRFNTTQMIEDLVRVERIPIDRLEKTVETYESQKAAWQGVNRSLTQLRDSARRLYGFENPFNDRMATSSDELVLTALATRQARNTTAQVIVEQTASADKMISGSLPRDAAVPAGEYGFSVGDRTLRLIYRGGSLSDFADSLTRRADGLVRANVIANTTNSRVLVLEAGRTGATNALQFSGAMVDFGLNIGMIEREPNASRLLLPAASAARDITNVEFSGATATVSPDGGFAVPVDLDLPPGSAFVLEYEARVMVDEALRWTPPQPPPDPTMPAAGSVSFAGVTVDNAGSQVELPAWEPPAPPPEVVTNSFVYAQDGGSRVALPDIPDSSDFALYQVPIGDYVGRVSDVVVENPNSFKVLEIRNLRIFDPNVRGEYRPVNAATTAQDAIVRFDGVRVVRETNTFDDLIPGVTLQLGRASPVPVSVEVKPDYEQTKNVVIEFIGYYNQLLRDVNILTRTDPDVIDEISYFTDEERTEAMTRLGMFQGDSTMAQIRNRLQNITAGAYNTDAGREVSLLAQIGISTNAGGPNTRAINANRLRGYLEINEAVFDEALRGHFREIQQLFGNDNDGDLVVDNGVAFQVQNLATPFVQVGGIIANRLSTIDGQITRANGDIETYERRIVTYEERLRTQFGRMEASINELESNSRDILNLNNRNNSDN